MYLLKMVPGCTARGDVAGGTSVSSGMSGPDQAVSYNG